MCGVHSLFKNKDTEYDSLLFGEDTPLIKTSYERPNVCVLSNILLTIMAGGGLGHLMERP